MQCSMFVSVHPCTCVCSGVCVFVCAHTHAHTYVHGDIQPCPKNTLLKWIRTSKTGGISSVPTEAEGAGYPAKGVGSKLQHHYTVSQMRLEPRLAESGGSSWSSILFGVLLICQGSQTKQGKNINLANQELLSRKHCAWSLVLWGLCPLLLFWYL